MNQKRIFCVILLFIIASLDICLARYLEQNHGILREKPQLEDREESLAVVRAFMLPEDVYEELAEQDSQTDQEGQEAEEHKTEEHKIEDSVTEDLLAYLFCQTKDETELKRWQKREKKANPQLYAGLAETVEKLLADAEYFPVPESIDNASAKVSYENSWQSERTYGGVRGHEGCDIMAGIQQRGYYPVVSVSDGIVEKIGWLPQGGYRIGIRSEHGVYFYYAHLAEYEEGMDEGISVSAGQLLGYMGDTGYSEVEGTTGNFPVHLHFGVYLDDGDGNEVSFNPYYMLKMLEKSKLKYEYYVR